MSYFKIQQIHILAGTDIEEAVREACALAIKEDCIVQFRFNSVEMEVNNFSDVNEKIDYYHRKLKENSK